MITSSAAADCTDVVHCDVTSYTNTCQTTTNNIKVVGESGGILAQWLKPSCHHLGLSLVAVLEVVGSIPAGDLCFLCAKSAVFRWESSCASGFAFSRDAIR